MGPFTVDASVFLNAFNPQEAGHEDSYRFLARLQGEAIPIVVPTLLLPEVAGTISRGRQDPTLAREFSRAISRLPHLVLVTLDATLAHQALGVAAEYRLRGSDAVYATVAIQFGSTLVTLDREQRERVAKIVPTRLPSEAIPS
jgi:predicted nucleic acid-binding protein